MDALGLEAARKRLGMSQAELGKVLGVQRQTVGRWEKGEAIPPDKADRIRELVAALGGEKPAPKLPVVAQQPAAGQAWRKLSNKEREALPLGSPGWRYKRGSTLPKGEWREDLAESEHPRDGVTVTAILWMSNGVGTPAMVLVGSTAGAKPQDRSDDFHTVPPAAYAPWHGHFNSSKSIRTEAEMAATREAMQGVPLGRLSSPQGSRLKGQPTAPGRR